jgi:hypothetical protein
MNKPPPEVDQTDTESEVLLPTSDDPPVPVDPEVLAWEEANIPQPPAE